MRWRFTPIRPAKIQSLAIPSVDEDVEELKLSYTAEEERKWSEPLRRAVWHDPVQLKTHMSFDPAILCPGSYKETLPYVGPETRIPIATGL